jgi:5'-nucleotidase
MEKRDQKIATLNMTSRRQFIRKAAIGAGLLALSEFPWEGLSANALTQALCIVHTNDVHSRLDPFPMDGSKYQGMGGVLAREKMIRDLRKKNDHVLLLDAGDIFQGTPYFNVFKGEPEMKIMSMLGYEAATLGNHDFDNGIDGLVNQMQYANFPFVNCNYDVAHTALENQVVPYTIIRKGKIKVGILGVGIELQGLVPDRLFGGIQYHDPIQAANETAYRLKKNKRCDYVICLSHLGFEYKDNKVSDIVLAKESEYIDLIIGGHTHTFLNEPHKVKNRNNQEVVINQVGWAGLFLGRINIYFDNKGGYDYVSNFTAMSVKETSV